MLHYTHVACQVYPTIVQCGGDANQIIAVDVFFFFSNSVRRPTHCYLLGPKYNMASSVSSTRTQLSCERRRPISSANTPKLRPFLTYKKFNVQRATESAWFKVKEREDDPPKTCRLLTDMGFLHHNIWCILMSTSIPRSTINKISWNILHCLMCRLSFSKHNSEA